MAVKVANLYQLKWEYLYFTGDYCIVHVIKLKEYCKMMQDVNVEQSNELRTIEIGQANLDENSKGLSSNEKTVVEHHSNFGPDMSGSDDDEASEVSYNKIMVKNSLLLFLQYS